MPVLHIVFALFIAGLLLYLINNYVPLRRGLKWVLNLLVAVLFIYWLLLTLGYVKL